MGIGDWGLEIAPTPKSPIPNPQSPIPNILSTIYNYLNILIIKKKVQIKIILCVNLIFQINMIYYILFLAIN